MEWLTDPTVWVGFATLVVLFFAVTLVKGPAVLVRPM